MKQELSLLQHYSSSPVLSRFIRPVYFYPLPHSQTRMNKKDEPTDISSSGPDNLNNDGSLD